MYRIELKYLTVDHGSYHGYVFKKSCPPKKRQIYCYYNAAAFAPISNDRKLNIVVREYRWGVKPPGILINKTLSGRGQTNVTSVK